VTSSEWRRWQGRRPAGAERCSAIARAQPSLLTRAHRIEYRLCSRTPTRLVAVPNGTAFFPSAIIDNSPPTVDTADANCPNGAGALFSFGWPRNGSTAAERAEGWREVLRGIPGLPEPSSVVGQAWAEEPYIMGAYGAWWPPGVISAAKEQWAALPGGRVFFASNEWSEVGAGYMNGAIHNGRKHGSIVAKRWLQEQHSGGSSVDG
jgi:hypothetical protein